MSKKDYKKFAELLKAERDFQMSDQADKTMRPACVVYAESTEYFARRIAEIFQADNPRFDTNKFLDACGFHL